VGKWRSRYTRQKNEALADAPRSGAPRSIDDKKVEEVITKTLETTPRGSNPLEQPSGLKPHRVDSFKLSADPMFVEKVRDIVGLYLNPPDKAIVLCVDEKSQTQALEHSQPILPLRPGLPEHQSHDDVRHGTLPLRRGHRTRFGPMPPPPPPPGIPGFSGTYRRRSLKMHHGRSK
jgi:hypothetical protein